MQFPSTKLMSISRLTQEAVGASCSIQCWGSLWKRCISSQNDLGYVPQSAPPGQWGMSQQIRLWCWPLLSSSWSEITAGHSQRSTGTEQAITDECLLRPSSTVYHSTAAGVLGWLQVRELYWKAGAQHLAAYTSLSLRAITCQCTMESPQSTSRGSLLPS